MQPSEAIEKIGQILDEERMHPTVQYEAATLPGEPLKAMAALAGDYMLNTERTQRPRKVHEDPQEYRFKSVNYELLAALFAQVDAKQRKALLPYFLMRIPDARSFRRAEHPNFPSWRNFVSELPLVAEFCVRSGEKQDFFRAVGEAQPTPALLLLLMQLEDMVALNWNLFTEAELEQLPTTLLGLKHVASQQEQQFKGTVAAVWPSNLERVHLGQLATDTVAMCDDIAEACRRARYFYLKGALLQGVNLEINQDKGVVESYLRKLGFNETLIQSLNQAERLNRSPSPFDLKSSMGHLRSFIENLHADAAALVAKRDGLAAPSGWGGNVVFLRDRGVINIPEERFVAGLYVLISDQAVHPLVAEREYARLSRNMVIEYGLLLLTKLEKLGLRGS